MRTSISDRARAPKDVDPNEVTRKREQFRKFLRMPPMDAGETIVRAVERRRSRVLVGGDAKGLSLLARLAPVRYWTLMRLGLPQ